jgi:hypothetical protein
LVRTTDMNISLAPHHYHGHTWDKYQV